MTKKKKKTPNPPIVQPPYTSENYKEVIKAYDAGLIHPEISPYEMFQDELTEDAILRGLDNIDYGCELCVHVHDDGVTCDAFPEGIPIDIFWGSIRHTKPYEGDNGIRFKRKKEKGNK